MSQDNHLIIEKDGYPLQIESIQTLNDGVQQALTNIAAVCGSNTILKGCADEVREGVTHVTDGIMCIGGKIYQFRGGKKTGGVTIITTKVDDIYDTGDGSAKQMLPVRGFSYVTSSPEGSSNIAWSSFVRVSDLKGLSELIPKVDNMYQHQILAKGVQQHTFHETVAGTIDPHISVEFLSPLNSSDYIVQLSVEILISSDSPLGTYPVILNSFNHTNKGFRVKARRQEAEHRITFNIHWIVFKK